MLAQKLASGLIKRQKQLASEEFGGSLPLFGLLVIPLVCFLGMAVDASRGYAIKSRISTALDAAALASIHSVGTEYFQQDVQKYFDANFPQGYLGATVTLDAPQVSDGGSTIQLTASAEISTTLMRLMNYETMAVAASTTVTTGLSSVDVVLSFDMSGSMDKSIGGGTRLSSARDAAEVLIDTLVIGTGNDNADGNVRFAVVPWNSNVNVTDGSAYNSALTTQQTLPTFSTIQTPYSGGTSLVSQDRLYYANNTPVPLLMAPPVGWNGCVYARIIANQEGENENIVWNNTASDEDDADFLRGQETSGNGNIDWFGWEPKTSNTQCLDAHITPLTTDQEAARTEVQALQNPDGYTNIPQGLAWAWRVLMPGIPYEEADTVATGLHKRAIVLLTDGENTTNSDDSYRGALNQGEMDARLLKIAQNAKDDGATIYVIQYADGNTDLQDLLKQVASEPASPYYNFAPDSIALEAVFQGIAEDLTSELRVAK